MRSSIYIRPLFKSDWKEVSKIYGDGMETGFATFETKIPKWKKWKKTHLLDQSFVAQKQESIVGFASLSPVSRREVYKGVAEVSVYVHNNFRQQGIGEGLLKTLILSSEENGFWTLQASIFPENESSINLHEKCGFRKIGVRKNIAQRNGEWYDNVLMERRKEINKK